MFAHRSIGGDGGCTQTDPSAKKRCQVIMSDRRQKQLVVATQFGVHGADNSTITERGDYSQQALAGVADVVGGVGSHQDIAEWNQS